MLLLVVLAVAAVAAASGHSHHPVFTGGLLGVSARVKLLEDYGVAAIELRRVPPLFTTLRGTASLGRNKGGDFELSADLQVALARRGVSILGINQHPNGCKFSKCDFVSVTISLPAHLGAHCIELKREE